MAVLTQPDRKSGRGRKISKSAVKQAITSSNVTLLQPENVNDDIILKQLAEYNLDLIVVAAFGQIFSQKLLSLPRLGCINIHASLLPRWRGASPIQHAILSGDKKTGVTIMQMASAMDAGDIWLQAECTIELNDTAESLHNKLANLGGEVILKAIDKIIAANQTPQIQDENKVTYCSKLNKADGLINWHEPGEIIMRKIRAFYPWPGAYTFFDGRRLRITRAETGQICSKSALSSGTVCDVGKRGFTVVTGDESSVLIKELVPEGGKKVSAVDFTNSNSLEHQQLGAQG